MSEDVMETIGARIVKENMRLRREVSELKEELREAEFQVSMQVTQLVDMQEEIGELEESLEEALEDAMEGGITRDQRIAELENEVNWFKEDHIAHVKLMKYKNDVIADLERELAIAMERYHNEESKVEELQDMLFSPQCFGKRPPDQKGEYPFVIEYQRPEGPVGTIGREDIRATSPIMAFNRFIDIERARGNIQYPSKYEDYTMITVRRRCI